MVGATGAGALRVGLLGYGFSGRTFHAPLIAAEPRLALQMVASSQAERIGAELPGIATERDPMIVATSPDIDLVVVATPNATHEPLARAALSAGKHVVIDKPFALNAREARGLVELAERRGLLLAVFHNRRWDSDFLTVRRAIEDGLIGELQTLEVRFDRFRPQVRERWREAAGPGAGVWFDLGPHIVDQALQLLGAPDGVQASLARQRPGAQTDDWAQVVLSFGERRAVLSAGMVVAGGTAKFVAHGSGGSIVKHLPDRQEAQLLAGLRPGGAHWGEDPDELVAYRPDGSSFTMPAVPGDQRAFYAGVAAALLDGAPNPVPPGEALAVMTVVEAAALSAGEGVRAPV